MCICNVSIALADPTKLFSIILTIPDMQLTLCKFLSKCYPKKKTDEKKLKLHILLSGKRRQSLTNSPVLWSVHNLTG